MEEPAVALDRVLAMDLAFRQVHEKCRQAALMAAWVMEEVTTHGDRFAPRHVAMPKRHKGLRDT